MHKKFESHYISKAVDWLIFNSVVKNRTELARKMGYTPATFSQIMEGKVGVTERFILKLQQIDDRLNPEWLRTGRGDMLQDADSDESLNLPLENEFQRSIIRAISAVEKIADSNRILAESNHDLTTTNKILATSNTELVQKLAKLIDGLYSKRRSGLYASAADPTEQAASDVEAPYDGKSE